MESEKEKPSTQEMVNGLVGNYLQNEKAPRHIKDSEFMASMMPLVESINGMSDEDQVKIKAEIQKTGFVFSDVQAKHHELGGGNTNYNPVPKRK